MARLPRYSLPGVPQHVIQRGNNRQAVFAKEITGSGLHYCIMSPVR